MKVLVIGANGFLGRHVVEECLKREWVVDTMYHIGQEYIPNQCKRFSELELNTLPIDYDVIFLLSAHIAHGKYDEPSAELLQANITFPLAVIKKFHQSHIIFSSSVSVYGNPPKTAITEETAYDNPSLYGKTKLAIETILAFHKKHTIFRFSSLYGKDMYKKTFLPLVIQHAKNNKQITLLGDGSRKQNYFNVADAGKLCVLAAIHKEYGTYLGVSQKSISNKEVAEMIKTYIPLCTIVYSGEDKNPSFIYDRSLTEKTFVCSSEVDVRQGIKEMLDD